MKLFITLNISLFYFLYGILQETNRRPCQPFSIRFFYLKLKQLKKSYLHISFCLNQLEKLPRVIFLIRGKWSDYMFFFSIWYKRKICGKCKKITSMDFFLFFCCSILFRKNSGIITKYLFTFSDNFRRMSK